MIVPLAPPKPFFMNFVTQLRGSLMAVVAGPARAADLMDLIFDSGRSEREPDTEQRRLHDAIIMTLFVLFAFVAAIHLAGGYSRGFPLAPDNVQAVGRKEHSGW